MLGRIDVAIALSVPFRPEQNTGQRLRLRLRVRFERLFGPLAGTSILLRYAHQLSDTRPRQCMCPSLILLRYHLNQIESKDATATDETANTGHPQASDEYNTETKTDPAAKQSGTTQSIDPKPHDDLIEP